jgi:BACON domain-containing protein
VRVIRCPGCQEPLPGIVEYCAKCGECLSPTEHSLNMNNEDLDDPDANEITQRIRPLVAATPVTPKQNALVSGSNMISPAQQGAGEQEDDDGDELHHRATWEKIVTHKTPRVTPLSVPVVSGPPAGSTPPALVRVRKTPPKQPRRIPAQLYSWVSILVLVSLLFGGVFGLVVSFGRGILVQSSRSSEVLSLLVTPYTVALGGIITLRGSNFSPSGRVGLTRDSNITLVDTGGANIIYADQGGYFSDTVIVDQSWGAGPHIIRAEDAILHTSASFTVTVTGQSTSLRPAHLLFSPAAIDLGSGDQATNSAQMITLSNAGGGQITWQAIATQSWLMISPKSGTFSYGQNMQVVVAVDRSNLKVGSYPASLIFTSNAGDPTLPVKMIVTQLQPGHQAVLQLTPAVLSFTGTDGATSPPTQVVTVSNPGVLALQWSASSITYDGFSWLSVYPQSGTVTKGSSQAVKIGVNISAMLPGVYRGSVTFTSQGAITAKDSPQTIYISLVVLPQCGIQVSPGGLTFAGVYLQPPPAQKIINVGVSQGCSTALRWSVLVTTSSGGKWLSVGPTGGVTPAYPSVSVATTGLLPGAYSGSVLFSWPGGTQTLPVTFIMGQPTTPIATVAPAILSFSGIIGQPGPFPQIATVTNTGGGTLTWQATAATTVGGAWLAITPATGTLASRLSASITVTATLLGTLTAGTYTGTITVTGTDSTGHPAVGSPLSIPVSFVVQAPCAIAATPPALVFQGVVGQPNPVTQAAAVTATGACVNALTWTATTATTPAGGTWLTATPAIGTASLTAPSSTSVGVVLTGLAAGTYSGTVTLTAIDSVTKLAVGTPSVVTITLTVQPVCTLQAPSVAGETFSSEVGLNPATQTFTVGVIGACTGSVTITPTATMASGAGWLAVSPASATVASGGSATFTVTVASAALAAGPYTGSISLVAVNGGIAITGSPQTVGVTLNVLTPPALAAGPNQMTFNVSTGIVSQPVTITNSGGEPLNWTAALVGAPNYVSLSANSGTNLAGGTSATINVIVDATGLPGGSTVTTSVVINAIDPITGLAVTGSPSTIPVTITIPPPQMVLSANTLTFTTTVGNNSAAQTINIQNTGGGTLTWSAGVPTQPWLTVTPTTGSDAAGQSTPVTLSVDVTGLAAGTSTATVVITPSVGGAVTVNVTLTIN